MTSRWQHRAHRPGARRPAIRRRSRPRPAALGAGSRRLGGEEGPTPADQRPVETLATQSAFAESFRDRRCLIPADSFYEWLTDDRGKRPLWFSRPDAELFAFAGVWAELRRRGSDDVLHSCAIVTCPPNDLMRPIHDRMPVILDPDAEGAWLDADSAAGDLLDLLVRRPTTRWSRARSQIWSTTCARTGPR